MSITPIAAAAQLAAAITEQPQAQPASSVDFANWMRHELQDVNGDIQGAEQSLLKLASGDANLHQVMLDLEKARLAMQLTVQVRNKLLEGYQEILRMQI